MRKLVAILVVTMAGCAAQARLPASYFAEDATALDPGHVSLTAVGGGGVNTTGDGGGVGARVRVGIGDAQEVGVEASQIHINAPSQECPIDGCEGNEDPNATFDVRSRSALVTYKRSFGDIALIGGLGGSEHAAVSGVQDTGADTYGDSVDGAFGFVVGRHVTKLLEIYGGSRATFAVPVGANNSPNASVVIGLTGAMGLATDLGDHVQLFTEAGALAVMDGNDVWFPRLDADAVVGLKLKL
ncbi:MAG TPA: hypothetical protein VH143_20625 [Kofleriaceae bacterium]|nr:hypothetical protein [Kofleriaceae bacterium]